MRYTLFLPAAILLFLSAGLAQEQSLKQKDVPKTVLENFRNAYPTARIIGFSKDVEMKTVTYEVESVDGEIHRDVTYTSDGLLVSIEETLPYDDMPEPVRSTLAEHYPDASISLCEKIMKHSLVQFEVRLTSGNDVLEVVLNPDGSVAKVEKK